MYLRLSVCVLEDFKQDFRGKVRSLCRHERLEMSRRKRGDENKVSLFQSCIFIRSHVLGAKPIKISISPGQP